jgi:hypothetical protein
VADPPLYIVKTAVGAVRLCSVLHSVRGVEVAAVAATDMSVRHL